MAKSPRRKRASEEDQEESFLDEIDEEVLDDAEQYDSEAVDAGDEGIDEGEESAEDSSQEEPEETVPPEPDHPDAVAALKDLGARLDTNEHGNVWRLFFYEDHGDSDVAQIHGLPSLKEIWLVGSKATRPMVEQLKEKMPNTTIYD